MAKRILSSRWKQRQENSSCEWRKDFTPEPLGRSQDFTLTLQYFSKPTLQSERAFTFLPYPTVPPLNPSASEGITLGTTLILGASPISASISSTPLGSLAPAALLRRAWKTLLPMPWSPASPSAAGWALRAVPHVPTEPVVQAVGDVGPAALRAQHQVRVPNEEVAVAARGHRHQLQLFNAPHLQPTLLPGLGERRRGPLRSHGWKRRAGWPSPPPLYGSGRAGGARRGRPGAGAERSARDAPAPPLPAAPAAGWAVL